MGAFLEGQVRPSQFIGQLSDCQPPVRLSARDIDSILGIARDSFPKVWTAQEFAYFLDHGCGYCYGLYERSQLGAYLIALLVQGELDIVSIATRLEHRKRGFAKHLLESAKRDPKVDRLLLEVDVENSPAIALYESLRFKRMGVRKGYYEQKRDAYRMELTVRTPRYAH